MDLPVNANDLFRDYMLVTGAAHTGPEPYQGELPYRGLHGKRLGLINGSSWITLWSTYFGRMYLPGVQLLNVGNEAVQVNFMEAYARGEPVPPPSNIETFVRYGRDLVTLGHVDAVMVTCSTMNRSFAQVRDALAPTPVIQIDMPMMERAVDHGGRMLVVATHGPTVENTQALLRETAERMGQEVSFTGAHTHRAWECLAAGDVAGHNEAIADEIRRVTAQESIDLVVLAQMSMSTLLFSYPDPLQAFGVPVLTSAQCGFERARDILLAQH